MRGVNQAAIEHFAKKINQLKQSLTTRNATVLADSFALDSEEPGIPEHCIGSLMVMEAVGDTEWEDRRDISREDEYLRVSKLLEAIGAVNAKSVLHGDIHSNSVRVSQTDTGAVYIVDFGRARLVNRKPEDPSNDVAQICGSILQQATGDDFIEPFCSATREGLVDYDLWIPMFRDPNLEPGLLLEIERIQRKANQEITDWI